MTTTLRGWLTAAGGHRARLVAVVVIAIVATVIRLYRLTRPGFLTGAPEYDDGVYFGDAVQLVHGHLPYRDFVMVHPPLITVLMAPVAALSSTIGTAHGLALARLLSLLASVAGVILLARLLRHRGTAAVVVGCAVLALLPDAVLAGSTLELEPWLALFCLAGLVVAFDGESIVTGRRVLAAGVLFGLAGAVKLWAVAPFVVFGVVLLAAARRRGARDPLLFFAGAVVGFVVPVVPFAALSPSRFFGQVFAAQLRREGPASSYGGRFASLFGVDNHRGAQFPPALAAALVAVVAIGAVAGYALLWLSARRRPTQFEVVGLGSALAVGVLFLLPSQYYQHYAGFFAPFLGLALALPASAGAGLSRRAARPRAAGDFRRAWPAVVVAAAVVSAVVFGIGLAKLRSPAAPVAAVRRVVPSGACAVSNSSALLLAADRFPERHRCRPIVDAYGAALYYGKGREGPAAARTRALQAAWRRAIARAQFVVLAPLYRGQTPVRYVRRAVRADFGAVPTRVKGLQIYQRHAPPRRTHRKAGASRQ